MQNHMEKLYVKYSIDKWIDRYLSKTIIKKKFV